MSKNWYEHIDINDVLKRPWPWIGIGMFCIALAWGLSSISSCAARESEARAKWHAESSKEFWRSTVERSRNED